MAHTERDIMDWSAGMLLKIRKRIRRDGFKDIDYCLGALKSVEMALRRETNPLLGDDMNGTKGIFKSVTFWADRIVQLVAELIGFGGVVYGRATAKKQIKGL
jgi:hypothetical protein